MTHSVTDWGCATAACPAPPPTARSLVTHYTHSYPRLRRTPCSLPPACHICGIPRRVFASPSRAPRFPQDMVLPGGHATKEKLFYTAADYIFPSGNKVEYRAKGVVVGPATLESHKGKGLAMQFPGNKGVVDCLLTQLSRTPPVRPPRTAARQHACRPCRHELPGSSVPPNGLCVQMQMGHAEIAELLKSRRREEAGRKTSRPQTPRTPRSWFGARSSPSVAPFTGTPPRQSTPPLPPLHNQQEVRGQAVTCALSYQRSSHLEAYGSPSPALLAAPRRETPSHQRTSRAAIRTPTSGSRPIPVVASSRCRCRSPAVSRAALRTPKRSGRKQRQCRAAGLLANRSNG